MENNKLFKFLIKDIAEIEELFEEKRAVGFDELEMEFIRTRFNGAKHIIQLLSQNENQPKNQVQAETVIEEQLVRNNGISEEKRFEQQPKKQTAEFTQEEKESLEALAEFEEEIKDETAGQSQIQEEVSAEEEPKQEVETVVEPEAIKESDVAKDRSDVEEETVAITQDSDVNAIAPNENNDQKEETVKEIVEVVGEKVGPDQESVESTDANNRLGDIFKKEKSVNDLMGGQDNKKLEYKISNSPVENMQSAIGINDRYQFIRELFDGNTDAFTKTVADLDALTNIQEAVSYLQQNFKWKKNDTSLKFVNLVKRRFPNG